MDATAQIFLLSLGAQATGAALLASVLLRLSRHYPRPYLPWWSAGWAALALAQTCAAIAWALNLSGTSPNDASRLAASGVSLAAGLIHAGLMLQGARLLAGWTPLRRRTLILGAGLAVATAVAAVLISSLPGTTGADRFLLRYGPRCLALAASFLVCGVVVWRYGWSPSDSGLGHRVVASGFLAFAAQQAFYFLVTVPHVDLGWARMVLPYAGFVELVLQWVVSIGLVGWLLEDERGHALDAAERARQTSQALEDSIAARQSLEGHLRQVQKMEAMGQLAGGIAHDFNNMLTAILGHAELLGEELPADDPRRDELDQIVRAARQAEALTRQLLVFSRRRIVQPVPLELNAVVCTVERMLRRVLGAHIALTVMPGASVPTVLADSGQLEQALLNLALNARDAMPDGGELRIVTEPARRTAGDERRPAPHARLIVEDTGTGIPEEMLPRIFEPFFTTKAEGEGTGLGLAMVYATISEIGGHIEVTSRVGLGTRFDVYLPEAVQSRDEFEVLSSKTEPWNGGH